MRRTFLIAIPFAAFSALAGCKEQKAPRIPDKGQGPSSLEELKAGGTDSGSTSDTDTGLSGDDTGPPATEGAFIDAEYYFSVKAMGIKVCDGPITLRIDPMAAKDGGGLLSATGCVECAGNPIHFDEIFGGAGLSGDGADEKDGSKSSVDLRDHVIAIPDAGPAVFRPSRPIIPSFLAASEEELRTLNVTRNVAVMNRKSGAAGRGTVSLRTLSFGEPYSSPLLEGVESLPNTMRFETVVKGFETVEDKFRNVLFDRLAMAISLDPIAIPEIVLEANIAQALALKDKDEKEKEPCPGTPGDGAGGLLGALKPLLGGLGSGGDKTGDGGGKGLGGIVDTLLPIVGKIIKLEIKLELVRQEGLEASED